MEDLYHKLPGRRRFVSPMPAAREPSAAPPSWAVGLGALAAVASWAFATLLYLNNR